MFGDSGNSRTPLFALAPVATVTTLSRSTTAVIRSWLSRPCSRAPDHLTRIPVPPSTRHPIFPMTMTTAIPMRLAMLVWRDAGNRFASNVSSCRCRPISGERVRPCLTTVRVVLICVCVYIVCWLSWKSGAKGERRHQVCQCLWFSLPCKSCPVFTYTLPCDIVSCLCIVSYVIIVTRSGSVYVHTHTCIHTYTSTQKCLHAYQHYNIILILQTLTSLMHFRRSVMVIRQNNVDL